MRGFRIPLANPFRSPPWVAVALLFALLVRMLVPVGYMPVVDADNRVRIQMCTPGGAVTVWRAARQDRQDPHNQASRADPCPFGLNAQAGDLPPPVLIAERLTPVPSLAESSPREDRRRVRSLFAPPPPARAPPLPQI